ncbi:MAG: hypothetical protein Tsb008_22650 [Rhodothalassiaceae bacterium]
MYVCICNGLNEARVRAAARESGERQCARRVYRHLGCRPQCGLCLSHAEKLIAEDRQEPAALGALAAMGCS